MDWRQGLCPCCVLLADFGYMECRGHRVAVDMARGLAFLHSRNIIHVSFCCHELCVVPWSIGQMAKC